uniref:Uncharacterized protein n=1 Tax=Acrobeloides nanus TaxID=290746 RepID=A0A914EMQ0_9BILA
MPISSSPELEPQGQSPTHRSDPSQPCPTTPSSKADPVPIIPSKTDQSMNHSKASVFTGREFAKPIPG